MELIRNLQFTRLLKASGRLHEFNFRKSNGLAGSVFNVDVADPRGNRHYLRFRRQNEAWKLEEADVPGWIAEVLPAIEESIQTANPDR